MLLSDRITEKFEDNLSAMRALFHVDKNKDMVTREFTSLSGRRCFLLFIDGMADGSAVNDFIIRPFLVWDREELEPDRIIQTNSYQKASTFEDVVGAVLNGDTAVFFEGMDVCYACETKGFEHRGISQPTTETTIKGSQEGFTESMRTNTTQIHRILKTHQLCTEFVQVGGINQDICAVMYLDDIVNKKTLAEVKKRLSSIQADFIMGSGMVEQLIEDSPYSLFPSLLSTEQPARAAQYLSSGRVIIIVDGSPFVIVAPVTLALLLDSPEGISQRWQNGTFTRIIRLFALFCSTMVSGIYLALVLFHREMIPTPLLGAIMNASANIPFPTVFEVLIMELFFELVREAGLRIPSMLGSAIGIVGALILGQSAVEANLVSPVTLIVVALSGLGNSALPDYDLAFGIRTVKIFMILMGASFGFLGIAVAIAIIVTILANQNSFGVPMLSIQSLKWSAGTPVAYQIPLWKQEQRPSELKPQKKTQAPKISRPWALEQGEDS